MAQSSIFRGTARKIVAAPTGTEYWYHNTVVVMASYDGTITLDSGGYRTATTKLAMNQASSQHGYGFVVYQERGEWYVRVRSHVWPFEDGMYFTVAQARAA